ncbi:aldehyde oxidoreductase [Oceanispirochaeta crateris]|uniref:Aldehyde oxidoreductase n=1 Tax=Oceanispirochaeta crateris TaxID=2518645 RepID=A0A5C1QIG7_9SPIO|nr:2Fe-2S iron-sulfur cluster-binding protein [Oceanispirochaeta crateris]QEN07955.1 aldehyde oxidoreductase [Oceanispirochaeta crateris]
MMLIEFTLNSELVSLDVPAYYKLSDVLRDEFHLNGLRNACGKGYCGLCTVALDGKLVYSCLIPVFQVRGRSVMTIEGYAQTEEFEDVYQGFKQSGVHLCDYCAPTRTLTTGILLSENIRPDEAQIQEIITTVNCSCTPYETLKKGILMTSRLRQRRLK